MAIGQIHIGVNKQDIDATRKVVYPGFIIIHFYYVYWLINDAYKYISVVFFCFIYEGEFI